MDASVLKEIQDFFAFLTGIITSFIEMIKGLFGGTNGSESNE